MAMHEIEVWVLVDQDGDYEVAKGADNAEERFKEEIGDCLAGSRMVKVTLTVEVPEPLTISAVIPAREGKVTMQVA